MWLDLGVASPIKIGYFLIFYCVSEHVVFFSFIQREKFGLPDTWSNFSTPHCIW